MNTTSSRAFFLLSLLSLSTACSTGGGAESDEAPAPAASAPQTAPSPSNSGPGHLGSSGLAGHSPAQQPAGNETLAGSAGAGGRQAGGAGGHGDAGKEGGETIHRGSVGHDGQAGSAGQGHAGSDAGGAAGQGDAGQAGSGPAAKACGAAADCPVPSPCAAPVCEAGVCGLAPLPKGTAVGSLDLACRRSLCDGQGGVELTKVDCECSPGTARCTDDNQLQRCGLEGTWEASSPCPGQAPVCSQQACTSVLQLAAGSQQSCALLGDGHVRCWGADILTPGVSERRPVGIAGIEQAISVQTGALHGCALDRDGAVWCWGHNEQRQLGAEAPWFSAKPQVVGGLPAITRLALGYSFSCALDQDGAVWCWGQLPGNVGAEAQAKPQKMSLPPATELVAGWQHVCARTTDKDVYCWGSGEQGQLGNGQTSDSTSPVLAAHVVEMSLSAGDDLTCASGDGTLTCWGRLGDRFAGVASQVSPSPTTLPAGAAVVQVALGYDFSCSRSGSGAVVCQGQSAQLQLGVWPDISEPLGPVGVSLPEPAASVVAGGSHACALLASGNAVCWGDNGSGQLGAGFDAPFAGPFAVAW